MEANIQGLKVENGLYTPIYSLYTEIVGKMGSIQPIYSLYTEI